MLLSSNWIDYLSLVEMLCIEFVYRPLLSVDYVILLGEPVGKGLAFAILGEFVLKTAGTLALRVQLLHQSGHKVLIFLEFFVHFCSLFPDIKVAKIIGFAMTFPKQFRRFTLL